MSKQSDDERLTGITAALFVEGISIREGMARAWQAGRESTGNPPEVAERKAAESFRAMVATTLDEIKGELIIAENELNHSRGVRADAAKYRLMEAMGQIDTLKRGIAL